MRETYSKANEIITAVVYKYLAVGYEFNLGTMGGYRKIDLIKDKTLIRIEIKYDKLGEYKVVVKEYSYNEHTDYYLDEYVPTVFSQEMKIVEEIRI